VQTLTELRAIILGVSLHSHPIDNAVPDTQLNSASG